LYQAPVTTPQIQSAPHRNLRLNWQPAGFCNLLGHRFLAARVGTGLDLSDNATSRELSRFTVALGQNWANPPMPHYDPRNDAMTIGFLMAGSPTAERTTSSYSEDIKSAFPVAKSTGKDSCS